MGTKPAAYKYVCLYDRDYLYLQQRFHQGGYIVYREFTDKDGKEVSVHDLVRACYQAIFVFGEEAKEFCDLKNKELGIIP